VSTHSEDIPDAAASQHGMAVLAAIKAMGESLTQAEASLAEGYTLDLAGLDGEIGRLCAAAQAAPPAMAPALRRGLHAALPPPASRGAGP
jgi:hypothetical protein